ncbi:hypothetical protein [Flagellimonas nanhaiensis]|uniref:Uncharacterized protein n=1 Tax=Flagellimonas nanhaiensis TaxID=2292706 RepID=A0A371JPJ8_9FLAO|nr:hypothetical protein [Allomuricauda nanhaiensis]RDY59440.1 hypothetical protein DX873_08625 [Allomuricauda nanhaiensis]
MGKTDKQCFNCGKEGGEFFGFIICEKCKSKLRLFTEGTVQGYLEKDPIGFPKDIDRRLELLDKDYVKKKIKLLHIKSIIN